MEPEPGEYDFVSARIVPHPNGLFGIVNDDTGESMGSDFRSREAAEDFARDHECDIVTELEQP